MILLRKENDDLKCLISQSFNQKNKFEAEKILDEIHSKAQSRTIGKKALCYIVKNGIIRGVGGSTLMMDKNGKIHSNLILDQWGGFLAQFFHPNSFVSASFNINDDGNNSENLFVYRNASAFNTLATLGSAVQVGSSATPPVRTNFNIGNPFGTAPENATFNGVSDPVYNSGLGNLKYVASITAGGSGTINESILVNVWRNSGNIAKTFALFRDIISPAQSFISGQSIALEYTVQL